MSVDNMLEALRDAIVITVIVIFLFLGNLRTMLLWPSRSPLPI